MKVIEDYIDNLDDQLLFEGDNIMSLFARVRSIKLSSKDKKEGKAKLKEIESTERYAVVKRAFIQYSKKPTRNNSIKLQDTLKKEVGDYAVAQTGTAFGVIMAIGFNLPAKLKGKPFGVDLLSSLVCLLAELPPVVITKLFSKSGKTLVQIKQDINSNNTVSKFGMIEGVVGFLLIIPWLVPAAAGAMFAGSMALISISTMKMFFSLYVGLKQNRFDKLKKVANKKASEIVESFLNKRDTLASLLF